MGLKKQILEVLYDSDEPLTIDELMERAEINKRLAHSVSSALCKSMREGLVVRGLIKTRSRLGPGKVAIYAHHGRPRLLNELIGRM